MRGDTATATQESGFIAPRLFSRERCTAIWAPVTLTKWSIRYTAPNDHAPPDGAANAEKRSSL